MNFLTTYEDSLYSTGPFPIQAHSLTYPCKCHANYLHVNIPLMELIVLIHF